MENKEKLQHVLRVKRFEKVCLDFGRKLSRLLNQDMSGKIISDFQKVMEVTEKAFGLVKQKQIKGDSLKYTKLSEPISKAQRIIAELNSEDLVVIVWINENYCATKLPAYTIQECLSALWELSEGDLIIALLDLDKGVCLEFNHYASGDEYELTSW